MQAPRSRRGEELYRGNSLRSLRFSRCLCLSACDLFLLRLALPLWRLLELFPCLSISLYAYLYRSLENRFVAKSRVLSTSVDLCVCLSVCLVWSSVGSLSCSKEFLTKLSLAPVRGVCCIQFFCSWEDPQRDFSCSASPLSSPPFSSSSKPTPHPHTPSSSSYFLSQTPPRLHETVRPRGHHDQARTRSSPRAHSTSSPFSS